MSAVVREAAVKDADRMLAHMDKLNSLLEAGVTDTVDQIFEEIKNSAGCCRVMAVCEASDDPTGKAKAELLRVSVGKVQKIVDGSYFSSNSFGAFLESLWGANQLAVVEQMVSTPYPKPTDNAREPVILELSLKQYLLFLMVEGADVVSTVSINCWGVF